MIDLTVVWSGPAACRLLAALGAEVVRVESTRHFPVATRGQTVHPSPGYIARARGPAAAYPDKDPGPDPYNRYGPFLLTGQGKLSCTMELDTEEGRRAFRRLVERSDVLVENNARATGEQLGLTWEDLRSVNPRLLLVRMAPLGLSGPYADALGFGAHFEAICGLASLRGYPDSPGDGGPTYHMDDRRSTGRGVRRAGGAGAPRAHRSGIDPAWGRPVPLLGQDNAYVYKELLGYDDEYDALVATGLIGTSY